MSAENRLILICAALWITTKVVLLSFVPFETNVTAGVMLNLFFIVLIGVYTIRKKVKETPKEMAHALDDIKSVAKATAKYVLWAIVLLFAFNQFIAKPTLDKRIENIKAEISAQYDDEAKYQELLLTNPPIGEMDREEAKAQALQGFDMYTKWYVQLTLALLGLMAAAIIYSILVSILWRNLMT